MMTLAGEYFDTVPSMDGVRKIQTSDLVKGGDDGAVNIALQALANRDAKLAEDVRKSGVWAYDGAADYTPPAIVADGAGGLYQCLRANGPGTEAGAKPLSDAGYWTGLMPKSGGTFAGKVSHEKNLIITAGENAQYSNSLHYKFPDGFDFYLYGDHSETTGALIMHASDNNGVFMGSLAASLKDMCFYYTPDGTNYAALPFALKPNPFHGIGLFVNLPSDNGIMTLPAGGTWAYHFVGSSAQGAVTSSFSGIGAGGVSIDHRTWGTKYINGFAWRIG